jgi:3-oxoacyl-[acyl-carrier protein] reductase
MNFDFKNKKILITGSSRGLGEDLVKKYLNYGAKVISVSRSKSTIKNKNLYSIKLNLLNKNSVRKLEKKIKNKKLIPDILINNLGGDLNMKNPLMDYSKFEKILRLNFGIGVELTNIFSKYMVKNNYGRICFVSSISGLENHGTPAYCAAKAAINGYVRSIGRFLIKDNVVITNVLPGAFLTNGGYWEKVKKVKKKHYTNFMKRLSIQILGTVDEISKIIIFMTSEATSFSAGSSFLVDGGQGRVLDTSN